MIILDTNVISEPLKPTPNQAVIDWLNAQLPTYLCTTTISISELKYGLARLPEGSRKLALSKGLNFALAKMVDVKGLGFIRIVHDPFLYSSETK